VFPGVFGGSSGVWAHAVIANSSLRMVHTMIRIVGDQEPAIFAPMVGSSVRISVCAVIGGPMGRIDFVGAYPVTLAATALAAVLRDRGGWPTPAHLDFPQAVCSNKEDVVLYIVTWKCLTDCPTLWTLWFP
jgi:hypothetical protein